MRAVRAIGESETRNVERVCARRSAVAPAHLRLRVLPSRGRAAMVRAERDDRRRARVVGATCRYQGDHDPRPHGTILLSPTLQISYGGVAASVQARSKRSAT